MFIELEEVNLFYRKSGSGAPLLMIHGNREDHQIFNELAADLATDFTIYQIDSRNHGQSSHHQQFSYTAMAGDVIQLIQKLNLSSVNLLGFSDGAIISLLVSQLIPDLIQKQILLGINLSPQDFKAEVFAEILLESQADPDPLIQLMLEEPNIPLEQLKTINTPSLIVAGADDVSPPEFYARVSQTLPQGELLIIPKHDHSSYIINNNLLAGHVLTFLTNKK